ncbi:hypothetical protein ACLKA6_003922, partial [Drosophila palustris]
ANANANELSAPSWLSLYFSLLEQPAGNERGVYPAAALSAPAAVHPLLMGRGAGAGHGVAGCRPVRHSGQDCTPLPGGCDAAAAGGRQGRPADCLPFGECGRGAGGTAPPSAHLAPLECGDQLFMAQKLCVAAELLQGESSPPQLPPLLDTEHGFVLGVLSAMGGYDLRPRVGLHCFHEGSHMIIASFTHKGRCLLAPSCPSSSSSNSSSSSSSSAGLGLVKVPLSTVLPQLDHSVFSLTRLPMNEMLLNAWTVLLYGPGTIQGSGSWELLNSSTEGRRRCHAALRSILKKRVLAGGYNNIEGNEDTETEPDHEQIQEQSNNPSDNGN